MAARQEASDCNMRQTSGKFLCVQCCARRIEKQNIMTVCVCVQLFARGIFASSNVAFAAVTVTEYCNTSAAHKVWSAACNAKNQTSGVATKQSLALF